MEQDSKKPDSLFGQCASDQRDEWPGESECVGNSLRGDWLLPLHVRKMLVAALLL